jgi:hypothetical protein
MCYRRIDGGHAFLRSMREKGEGIARWRCAKKKRCAPWWCAAGSDVCALAVPDTLNIVAAAEGCVRLRSSRKINRCGVTG